MPPLGSVSTRVLIDVHDLPDDRPSSLNTIWMPAGSIPFVHWINGPELPRPFFARSPSVTTLAIRKSRSKVDQLKEQGLPVPEDALVKGSYFGCVSGAPAPIHEMSLEGPPYSSWPPHPTRMLGVETRLEKVALAKGFQNFLSRALTGCFPGRGVRMCGMSVHPWTQVAARLAMQRPGRGTGLSCFSAPAHRSGPGWF